MTEEKRYTEGYVGDYDNLVSDEYKKCYVECIKRLPVSESVLCITVMNCDLVRDHQAFMIASGVHIIR